MPTGTTAKPISLLPREHGAYAQLGVSLLAALALVPLAPRAWAQALATVLVFLASEPLLLLTGRRGEEARLRGGPAARVRAVLLMGLLLPAFAVAWLGASPTLWATALPAVLPALGLLALFLRRREHTLPGELLAALAFSFTALPVARLGDAAPGKAWALAFVLAALHGVGTVLVRGILWSMKANGARWPRLLAPLLALVLAAVALALPLPWWAAMTALPLLLASLRVAAVLPSPKDFRILGWILTAASLLGAVIALLALATSPS